jgi:hypothetical protein
MVSCVDSLACVPSWNFISKKILTDFLWYPHALRFARTRLLSWVPRVDKSLMWVCCACVEERLAHRYARTRRAIPWVAGAFFLVSGKFCLTRSHHKRSFVSLPLRGFSPPVPGSILRFFLGFCWGSIFVNFDLSSNFLASYIIINTPLTSSHRQNLLSTRHEIVKTRQHTKNGQKWLFLRVSKKGLKMAVFLACFWPHRKIMFFWHQHIINTSKNEALKKCLKKMSFWKKSKIF